MTEADESAFAVSEFQQWFDTHQTSEQSTGVILFLQDHQRMKDGSVRMKMSFSDDSDFTIVCPFEYPYGKNLLFDVRSECDRLKDWVPKVKAFASENRGQVKLPAILSKCIEYYQRNSGSEKPIAMPSPQQDSDFEDEPNMDGGSGYSSNAELDLLYGDDNFTTTWDIEMDFLKKRWLIKEKEMRASLDSSVRAPSPDTPSSSAAAWYSAKEPNKTPGAESDTPAPKKAKWDGKSVIPKAGQQIFDHESAAFQILSNEMVALLRMAKMEASHGGQCHFSCETVDDSLYRWRVHVGAFPNEHPLRSELAELKEKFGYDTIELQLDFLPDFPFYPPLLRLVRPRLKGSLVQSLANIDVLKLTFWNPAKTVHEVLKQIKDILMKHARLDVQNERNDKEKFPEGAYLPLEDYLIKLALATEVRPRAYFDLISIENLERAPQLRTKTASTEKEEIKKKMSGWKAGVGYGSGARSSGGWNPEQYIIAQQEQDKQILGIMRNIVQELVTLGKGCTSDEVNESYAVAEGSCLLPLLEQHLSVGSFIEIERHLELYQLILDVLDAISTVPNLVPLLGNVPRQKYCIMYYLSHLNTSATEYLDCVKTRIGSTAGSNTGKQKTAKTVKAIAEAKVDDEKEKKAKEDRELATATKITDLFTKLTKKVSDARISYSMDEQQVEKKDRNAEKGTMGDESLMQSYVRLLKPLQFQNIEMTLTGQGAHKFSKNADDKLSQETRTIWKEWTALKSSLPLNLESSVFVRVDESHMNLMQALITGPEGTPYANGAFVFDICFPLSYPSKPPLVTLRTTGGGRVRFNPNLYNCGKVCLSLLGTWSGDSGENWNAKTSTLLQVLVSIQSLILTDEPYFNEPGYERTMGTPEGKKNSEGYNKGIRANCVRYAMLEQLQQLPPGFEEVVRLHYKIKADIIVKQLDEWMKLDPENRNLKGDIEKMKKHLSDLQAST